ncbi:hypothetical protein V496_09599 [Pseudogymnoascus sp. VKM F-4515 (FW-2607)]|nr:hypothetical protein V496_09599 [Pseudogymnoascus sp. VKM F-4515 (FW-2607)]KFY97881.1 hypothetical protein V498_01843 [Pseudogymnoascus sp. VKM F-4517 (FW-2822)]
MPRDTVRLLDEDDLIRWREGTVTALPSKDEPGGAPDAITNLTYSKLPTLTDFHKANIQLRADTKTSLLTKALQPSHDDNNDETFMAIDMARHRSSRSTTSSASTADLTSDGGLTSPTRTSTPSPPFPPSSYMSLAPYTLGPKLSQTAFARTQQQKNQDPAVAQQVAAAAVPKPDPAVEALVKKRCISFACAAQKPQDFIKSTPTTTHANNAAGATATTTAPKRTIKFACNGPQPDRQAVKVVEPAKIPRQTATPASPAKAERHTIRSPTLSRKLRSSTPQPKAHRDSTSTIRRASQSPAAVRSRKPKYIVADEDALESSEATRFHEFASDEPQEDDWIRKDTSTIKGKLTIHDTLKKENAIRQLGKEAEEEALEDGDDDDDDDNNDDDDDDDDDDDENDDDDDDDEDDNDEDDNTVDGSDVDLDASDGNETDNEAGFADSDDESDRGGEFHFWSPGMSTVEPSSAFRSSVRRAPSDSSIDSLSHMSPTLNKSGASRKSKGTRKIRIRPGTPDLPDSTDFVCGTLDEDRPLEEAYVSCMEARKREKRHVIPQDIDPSFPTSDPENEEDENDEVEQPNDSDDGLWLHGKFEDSESETRHRRRTRKSPKHSPKRLVSPPPQKYRSPPGGTTRRSPRLRSPPPRRAKSPPPRRAKSPAPARARAVKWPATSASISFAPMPNRPDPTHTKSLPRRPNAFCQQYRQTQLAFANGEDNDNTDGYTRGAIDIVKGLEQKRQRRKDKFFSKLCNRARKGQQVERRPQPGKGAERMRELGLQMAGKTEYKGANAEYVLSV